MGNLCKPSSSIENFHKIVTVLCRRCIQVGLKPYMSEVSSGYMAEAVKPLLVLEKERDQEAVAACLEQFACNMRRHILCLEHKTQ